MVDDDDFSDDGGKYSHLSSNLSCSYASFTKVAISSVCISHDHIMSDDIDLWLFKAPSNVSKKILAPFASLSLVRNFFTQKVRTFGSSEERPVHFRRSKIQYSRGNSH